MMEDKNKAVVFMTTGLLVTMLPLSDLNAETSPFAAEVFRVSQYQMAELVEEGCGGEMTEYRRPAPEEEQASESKEEEQKEDSSAVEDESESFWVWLKRLILP